MTKTLNTQDIEKKLQKLIYSAKDFSNAQKGFFGLTETLTKEQKQELEAIPKFNNLLNQLDNELDNIQLNGNRR